MEQGTHQHQPPVAETPEGARRLAATGTPAGDMGCGQCRHVWRGWRHLGAAPNAHHQQRRQRHGQPAPFSTLRIGHFGLFPMPTTAFGVPVADLDLGAHAIPDRVGYGGWQIGQNQPGFGIGGIPLRQLRTSISAEGEERQRTAATRPPVQPAR